MNHLAAFAHQTWAITRDAMRALDARAESMAELVAKGMTLIAPIAGMSPAECQQHCYNGGNPIVPEIDGDVATIEILGDIIGRAPWWAKAYLGAIDPFDVADAIDALAADPRIATLVIEMDCCGGTTCGTAEAAAAITRFQAAGKTVEVRVAGTMASAAYWIAAGADRIIATPTSRIGYLGTLMVLCDDTAAIAAQGLRYEVVSSAPLKGIGHDGAVTPPYRAMAQRLVDALTVVFKDAVSAGRGLDAAKTDAVFTGDGWLASEALALGLIDAIDSPADELDQPDGTAPAPVVVPPPLDDGSATESHSLTPPAAAGSAQESIMDTKTQAALADLTKSHPTHAAAFVAEALKPGATADGLTAFATGLTAKAKDDAHAAEVADLKAKAEAAEAKATAAETAKATAATELAALKAHVPKHQDPGGGSGGAPAGEKTQAEIDAMEPIAQAAFFAAGGKRSKHVK